MRINLTALSELYELARKELSSAYDNGKTITYLTMYLPPILDLELLKVSGPRFFSSKKPLSKASLILEISSFLKSSNSESEYSISLDFIHDAIERLKECTLNDLASMLELFFISALQFREDPPPLSHSDFIPVPQRGQHCKRDGTYLSWRMINTELREDLHQKVTTGKVFDNHCYYCGHYIP